MTLRILTTALTSGELLRVQVEAIRTQIKCEQEIVVINDAYDEPHFSNHWTEGMPAEIGRVCKELGVAGFRLAPFLHDHRDLIFPDEPAEFRSHNNANSRCADAIQFGLNRFLHESTDPIMVIDADMIPTSPFDPYRYLSQKPIWGYPQNVQGVRYLWNGIMLLDPANVNRLDLFNVDCGQVAGIPVDVGGQLHRFLEANDGLVGEFLKQDVGPHGYEVYEGSFTHLRAGGNWEVHERAAAQGRLGAFIAAVS